MTKSAKTPDPDGKPTVREVIIAKPDQAALAAAVRAFLRARLLRRVASHDDAVKDA
jgi:hypothetical protein